MSGVGAELYPHSIKLDNKVANQFGYMIDMQIGWPLKPQPEGKYANTFVIDTSSSDIVVATSACTGCSSEYEIYDPTVSRNAEITESAK